MLKRLGLLLWLRVALGLALWLGGARTAPAQSHLRRSPPVQHAASAKRGDLLVGLGAAYASNVRVPLLDIDGDLTRIGVADLAFAPADGIVVEFRTDLYRALTVERFGPSPAVEPDEGVADGKSTGSGNVRIIGLFRLLGGAQGLSGGLHLELTIPSGNQREGLGTNTTDVRVSGMASYGDGPLRLTGDVGVAVLEAPLESFEQNDVIVYSAELLLRLSQKHPARLYAGVDGRASTRGRVPIGTEDLGELRVGGDYAIGRWLVDAGAAIGFAGISPEWEANGGISWLVGGRKAR
ncbi:MAG: hypothetical protein HY702_07245 [Gemmatimonadetes bacterium]|nr:hypothetical protein [Gemmatimonadota bacterium]